MPYTIPSNAVEIQIRVQDFVDRHGLESPLPIRVLDLVSDVGEISREILKATDYGRHPLTELPGNFSYELADTLFSLICIANSSGVNLGEALNRVLQKYEERLVRTGDAGSGA